MCRRRFATCEAILRHIGRVHFPNQVLYIWTYKLRRDGSWFKVLYDWIGYKSEYDNNGVATWSYSSPHRVLAFRHPGVVRGADSKPRLYSVKPMIHVLGLPLTEWERLGMMHLFILLNLG